MQSLTPIPRSLDGLTMAAVLADPALAAMAAAELETVTIRTSKGRSAKAALAKPKAKGPAVLLLHEWWGLNDQIKSVAREFANQGYLALAIDLYDGKIATNADDAGKYMGALDRPAAIDLMGAAIDFLARHPLSTGKVGTVGWCMGGGLSLDASIARPVDATIVYYGSVTHPLAELKKLKGPLLGHFAERDQWIDHKMVDPFEDRLKQAGKRAEIHWYRADHAFANPTGDHYQKPDAELSWRRTLDFFKANLR